LAQGLSAIPELRVKQPRTNIVQVNVAATGMTAKEWEAQLRARAESESWPICVGRSNAVERPVWPDFNK